MPKSRLSRVLDGDRDAAREAVEAHHPALAALLAALGERLDRDELVEVLLDAAPLAEAGVGERALLLFEAADAALARRFPDDPESPHDRVSARDLLGRLARSLTLGISAAEAAALADELCRRPELAADAERLRAALVAAGPHPG